MDNNDQLLIERGVAAQDLIDNPVFATVVNDLLNYYAQSCMNSSPDQKELRDQAYYQSRALTDVVAVLRQWANMKDMLLSNSEEDDNE